MDEMKIVSKFTTNVISKLVNTVLRKKLGYNVDIQLNEIRTTINEGKIHVHLDIDAESDKNELAKLLNKLV